MRFPSVLSVLAALGFASGTQAQTWEKGQHGETALFQMEHAPFPHPSRAEGHKDQETDYPADTHYADSTVALFLPNEYQPGEKTDLLFYFHGWDNSVGESLEQFDLRGMAARSGQNVILVFPEGPKNAKDSTLGKIEDEGGLARLSSEVIDVLKREKRIPPTSRLGDVLLSGHSGAYRGIAHALDHGGLDEHITDVLLLDASYANLDWFAAWAAGSPDRRLRSVFTDHLAPENAWLMAQLSKAGIPFEIRLDTDLEVETLRANRLVFVLTQDRDHNETVELLEVFLSGRPDVSDPEE